jgi:hypothetical protein
MSKFTDLVRDYRREFTAEGDITVEVIDRHGNHVGGSNRKGKKHIQVITNVPVPGSLWYTHEPSCSRRH